MTYSLQQKNKLCKKYIEEINSFCKIVQNSVKSKKGNCYLYHADLRFPEMMCPVAGEYNIPLGEDKDTRDLKDEMEVIISTVTNRGKNVVIVYVKDEVIGLCLGK